MKIILLCLVFSVPFHSCIIGGQDSNSENYGFVVSLRNIRIGPHFCGGIIIEQRFVLTAATCVKDIEVEDLLVVAGIRNLNDTNGIKCNVDKVISKDPTGRNEVHNNIALLRLTERIPEDKLFDPMSLLRGDNNPAKEGDQGQILGWGQKYLNQPELTNHLQMAYTKISSLSNCRQFNSDIDESNLCTLCIDDFEGGLCEFDTGNPLLSYSDFILWGIATKQYACGSNRIEDVYTRVEAHKDWIFKVMKENTSTNHKPQIIVMSIIALLMLLLN